MIERYGAVPSRQTWIVGRAGSFVKNVNVASFVPELVGANFTLNGDDCPGGTVAVVGVMVNWLASGPEIVAFVTDSGCAPAPEAVFDIVMSWLVLPPTATDPKPFGQSVVGLTTAAGGVDVAVQVFVGGRIWKFVTASVQPVVALTKVIVEPSGAGRVPANPPPVVHASVGNALRGGDGTFRLNEIGPTGSLIALGVGKIVNVVLPALIVKRMNAVPSCPTPGLTTVTVTVWPGCACNGLTLVIRGFSGTKLNAVP